MLVLRVFEPVVLDRVEPLRRVAVLRAADVPEERLVVAPLRVRLLAVPRERVEDVLRAVPVRLREEVERPVVRRVVEPVRDRVVLRAAVLRAVALPPLRPAAFCWAVERDLVDELREVVVLRAVVLRGVVLRAVVLRAVVLRAVVFRAAVLRAVALPPLRPAAFCWAVERLDVDELRDVFDAPLVFRAVDLVRANALRLPSLDDPDRRSTTESRTGRIVKTRSDVSRKRA